MTNCLNSCTVSQWLLLPGTQHTWGALWQSEDVNQKRKRVRESRNRKSISCEVVFLAKCRITPYQLLSVVCFQFCVSNYTLVFSWFEFQELNSAGIYHIYCFWIFFRRGIGDRIQKRNRGIQGKHRQIHLRTFEKRDHLEVSNNLIIMRKFAWKIYNLYNKRDDCVMKMLQNTVSFQWHITVLIGNVCVFWETITGNGTKRKLI